MSSEPATLTFQCRITLFTVHGLVERYHLLTVTARVHADSEAYTDDLVAEVLRLRDNNLLTGDWSTGAILVECLTDMFYQPMRLIRPRTGKRSIFD